MEKIRRRRRRSERARIEREKRIKTTLKNQSNLLKRQAENEPDGEKMPRGEGGGSTKGGPLGYGAKAISLSRGIRGMARLEDHASRTLWFFLRRRKNSGERRGRRANKARRAKEKERKSDIEGGRQKKKRDTKGGHGKRSNGVQSRERLRLKVLVMAFGEQFCIETVVLPPPFHVQFSYGRPGGGERATQSSVRIQAAPADALHSLGSYSTIYRIGLGTVSKAGHPQVTHPRTRAGGGNARIKSTIALIAVGSTRLNRV